MKLSARNKIQGKVKKLTVGQVNAEVVIEVGGAELVSVITASAAKELKLKKGRPVCAVIKASDVMIAACAGGDTCTCGKGH